MIGAWTVGDHRAFADSLAHMDHGTLVDAGPVVRAHKLQQIVDIDPFFGIRLHPFTVFRCFAVFRHNHLSSGHRGYLARSFTDNHGVGIFGHLRFHPCSHHGGFRNEQRYPLALHVRAHQGSVRIIMFQERNERGRHRNQLLRRYIHVMNFVRFNLEKLAAITNGDSWRSKLAMTIHRRVRLRHNEIFLLIRREEIQFIGDFSRFHLAIRGLNESEFIDPTKGRQAGDQADVRAFWRFDRADPSVMGRMHVADFESCAFPTQTPGSKGGQTTFVRHFAQGIRLIHQLRELTPTKEVTNHRRQSLRVDQFLRSHSFGIDVKQRHPLFHQSLRSAQACPALIGEKLSHRPYATTAQMINVIRRPLAQAKVDQITGGGHHIFPGQNAGQQIGLQAKLLIQLVPTHATDVITLRIEEKTLQQRLRVRHRGGIAGAQTPINFFEGGFGILGRILLQTLQNGVIHSNIHHLYRFQAEVEQAADHGFRERFKSPGHDQISVRDIAHFFDQHLLAQLILFQILRQFHRLNPIKQRDDVLIGAVVQSTQQGG